MDASRLKLSQREELDSVVIHLLFFVDTAALLTSFAIIIK